MDFKTWKQLPPVQQMAHRLGFDADLAECLDWDDYTASFIAANDDNGRMVTKARGLVGYLSTGERPVLAAMLHAADFSRVADELAEQETWRQLDRTYGDHAAAVALAILRQ
jgi:hypothetical protein